MSILAEIVASRRVGSGTAAARAATPIHGTPRGSSDSSDAACSVRPIGDSA